MLMIDCPACARTYHVGRADLDGGRTLVCPRCDARWFVGGDGTRREPIADTPMRRRAAAEAWSAPRRSLLQRLAPLTTAIICIAATMTLIGAREQVARIFPRGAAIYKAAGLEVNVRGLEFAKVTPGRSEPSSPEVVVSGQIRNVAGRRVSLPRVAYEVRDAAGAALVTWSEKSPAKALDAGASLPFASAPHSLPPEARTVMVRFLADADTPIRLASGSER